MGGAHALGLLACDQVAAANVGERGHLGFEQGAVDMLAATRSETRKESGEDAAVGVEACCQI